MKVAMLCPHGNPPVQGGAERLWRGIVDAINRLGPHHADLVSVEALEANLPDVVRSYATFDALDMSDYDLVISGKYPAWMIRHPRSVVYMAHPIRGLYDTYSGPLQPAHGQLSRPGQSAIDAVRRSVPGRVGARQRVLSAALALVDELAADHPDLAYPGPLARSIVQFLDRDALSATNTVAHLAISQTVADRVDYFPDPNAVEVLVPPSGLADLRAGPGVHLFTASRLDAPKRLDLLIDAMRFVEADIELRIAGIGPQEQTLRARASADDRIRFLGFLDDVELANEYSTAIAVPFVPKDEDLGLITLEAQMSHKPVVTCHDSGGSTELVTDGIDGLIVEPTPSDIGRALQRLIDDPDVAAVMGERAFDRAQANTWDTLVSRLVRNHSQPTEPPPTRPVVVVLSTFAAYPPLHGGQIRLHRLSEAVSSIADVRLIAIGDQDSGPTVISPGFVQYTVRPDHGYHEINMLLTGVTGAPCGDIAATLAKDSLGGFSHVLAEAAHDASVVILAHPFLDPLLHDISVPHVIYDAYNFETELKRAMYAETDAGSAVADAVRQVESAAVRRASLVTAVSEQDLESLRSIAPSMAEFAVVSNGSDVLSKRCVLGPQRRARRDEYLNRMRSRGLTLPSESIALFVGSGHPPNVNGALELLRLADSMPSVLFLLIGSHVDALGGVPTASNVIARGEVSPSELNYLLSCCDVALNPMSSGSGTNIKMLDYFAAGAPVVSTEVGARGLGATAGVHYHEADLAGFAAAVSDTIHDHAATERRARAARKLAEATDWTDLGARFAGMVAEIVASGPTSTVACDSVGDPH